MENLPRTLLYRAMVAERRRRLQAHLETLFPQPSEFVWEVGAGHGHFLTAYASAHPRQQCVGIDIVSERVERALRKRDRARLPNLAFIQAEARLFLEALPAHAHIRHVFVLFPDPWPKVRHHKHRILQAEFLRAVAERAARECRLHFRTDFRPYFQAAQSAIADDSHWRLVDESWPFEFETVFQSRAASHHSFTACLRGP